MSTLEDSLPPSSQIGERTKQVETTFRRWNEVFGWRFGTDAEAFDAFAAAWATGWSPESNEGMDTCRKLIEGAYERESKRAASFGCSCQSH